MVAVGHLEWVDLAALAAWGLDQAVGLGSEERVVRRWECRVDLGLAVAAEALLGAELA
jgi:hypothetical protein